MKLDRVICGFLALTVPGACWGSVVASAAGNGSTDSNRGATDATASFSGESASARAEAHGSGVNGHLKAFSLLLVPNASSAFTVVTSSASIFDEIALGDRTLSFHLSGLLDNSTLGEPNRGTASASFSALWFLPDTTQHVNIVSLEVVRHPAGWRRFVTIGDPRQDPVSASGIAAGTFTDPPPPEFDFTVTIPKSWFTFDEETGKYEPLPMLFELKTAATCPPATPDCFAAAQFDRTVYIGIGPGYTSLSGYQYAGLPSAGATTGGTTTGGTTTGGGTTGGTGGTTTGGSTTGGGTTTGAVAAVPEPSTVLLSLGGLALLAARRRKLAS